MTNHPRHHTTTAFMFDGTGKCTTVPITDLGTPPDGGFAWIHLVASDPATKDWLETATIPPIILSAITAEETRPRCTAHGDDAIVILRGVNLNEGAKPDDMISVRLWISKNQIVSYALRPLKAVHDTQISALSGTAATGCADLLGRLTQRLADRAEPTVAALNEQLDTLEEGIIDEDTMPNRSELGEIRRAAIALRRYMLPQKDALTTLLIEDFTWLTPTSLARLHEATDRITFLSEELDEIRDRAQIIHDQIIDKRAERMNHQMFVLSAVAGIFLPLGFITGLLGINVGGIPGMEYGGSFAIVCAGLALIAAALVWLFRKWGLL